MADRHEDKAWMLMNISFPPPTPYDRDGGQEGPPGTAYHLVFGGTNKKKSPGPDGIGPLVTACVYR